MKLARIIGTAVISVNLCLCQPIQGTKYTLIARSTEDLDQTNAAYGTAGSLYWKNSDFSIEDHEVETDVTPAVKRDENTKGKEGMEMIKFMYADQGMGEDNDGYIESDTEIDLIKAWNGDEYEGIYRK